MPQYRGMWPLRIVFPMMVEYSVNIQQMISHKVKGSHILVRECLTMVVHLWQINPEGDVSFRETEVYQEVIQKKKQYAGSDHDRDIFSKNKVICCSSR